MRLRFRAVNTRESPFRNHSSGFSGTGGMSLDLAAERTTLDHIRCAHRFRRRIVGHFFYSVTSDVLNDSSKASAKREMKPLYGKKLDESFRTDFTNAFMKVVQSSPWYKTLRVEFPKKDERITTKEVNQSSFFKAVLFHGLSSSAFVAKADLLYFRRGQTHAPYFPRMIYFSQKMSSESIEKAVARWAENDGALYRQAASEAATEISRMIKEDFFDATASVNESPPESKITIWDGLVTRKTEMHGYILHEDGNRIVFRRNSLGTHQCDSGVRPGPVGRKIVGARSATGSVLSRPMFHLNDLPVSTKLELSDRWSRWVVRSPRPLGTTIISEPEI